MMSSATSPAANDWPVSRTFRATLTIAATAAAFALAYLFRAVVFLLFMGILIAIALKPAVRRLRQVGFSPATASVLTYGLLIVLALGGLIAGAPTLAGQFDDLLASVPDFYQRAHDYLTNSSLAIVRRLSEELPEELPKSLDLDREEAEGAIQAVAQGVGFGQTLLKVMLGGLASLLLAFYWSLHEDRAVRACLLALPASRREGAKQMISEGLAKLGSYLRGQALLCLIMGLMVLVVYWLIGLPYVVALAAAAGALEAVPVFGPVLGAVPALIVALSVSPAKAAWTLAAVVAMQQFEGNVLVPRIMDRSVGVSAVVTMLAIVGFSAVGGFPGAVLAIPIAAIMQLVFERLIFSPSASEPAPPLGRDAVSRLRYQAQELAHDAQLNSRKENEDEPPASKSDRLEEGIESLAHEVDRYLGANFGPTAVTTTSFSAGESP